ncbi:hypothetical protein NDU88_005898 [Pleurodeles waltl]|uniref:Uncharacterized protein n=1 Tax=Pleurodeles waltl TaxID=8319 RepID=A0AAV7UK11_PLEWA|nr:hypothetical protein NDU88_005898 [Pleurodeles waltl]
MAAADTQPTAGAPAGQVRSSSMRGRRVCSPCVFSQPFRATGCSSSPGGQVCSLVSAIQTILARVPQGALVSPGGPGPVPWHGPPGHALLAPPLRAVQSRTSALGPSPPKARPGCPRPRRLSSSLSEPVKRRWGVQQITTPHPWGAANAHHSSGVFHGPPQPAPGRSWRYARPWGLASVPHLAG